MNSPAHVHQSPEKMLLRELSLQIAAIPLEDLTEKLLATLARKAGEWAAEDPKRAVTILELAGVTAQSNQNMILVAAIAGALITYLNTYENAVSHGMTFAKGAIDKLARDSGYPDIVREVVSNYCKALRSEIPGSVV